MSTTYRAAYFTNSRTGQETVLTGPEQSGLDDVALKEAAIAEAIGAGIVDQTTTSPQEAYPHLTMDMLVSGLSVGDWTDA